MKIKTKKVHGIAVNLDQSWAFAILRLRDKVTGYFWSSHILLPQPENHIIVNNIHNLVIESIMVQVWGQDFGLTGKPYDVDYCEYYYLY